MRGERHFEEVAEVHLRGFDERNNPRRHMARGPIDVGYIDWS